MALAERDPLAGWGGVFEVADVSSSKNPPRIAVITTNGRYFDFAQESAVVTPLPGDLILHATCDVTPWRTTRAMYIVEIARAGEEWLVAPRFPVWPDELPDANLAALALVDYTGQGRSLRVAPHRRP